MASPPPPVDHSAAIALLKERKARLDVAEFVHERAAAALKAEGVPGMDEQRVFLDWMNDILASRDPSAFKDASADPGRSYLGYVSERVVEPYHVSYRAVNALAKQVAEDEVNTFVHVRWHQEIAWARRLRAGEDDRVAVLAQLFLRAAAKDPCKVFVELAAAWGSALDDLRFSTAPEHNLSESAIRDWVGDEPEPVAIGDEEHKAMVRILAMPFSWLNQLSDDFRDNGAMQVETFRSWSARFSSKGARFPRDPVTDYGMHLVRLNYRKPAA